MDLNVMHNTLERDCKEDLKKQYHQNNTSIDMYEIPEGIDYTTEVKKLGINILKYLIKQDETKAKHWISTSSFDF